MVSIPTVTLFTSASAAERLDRARTFLTSRPPLTEAVVVSITREAADDFVRQCTLEQHASFGVHRLSVTQLIARIAGVELARLGVTPMSALGTEALAARAAFESLQADELRYFTPVAKTRGFPGSLAATLNDLRLSGLAADDLPESGEALDDLRILLRRYTSLLEGGNLADRMRLIATATGMLRAASPPFPGDRLLIWLDAPLTTVADRDFAEALWASVPAALVTLPSGDARSIAAAQPLAGAVATPASPHDTAGNQMQLRRLREHLFSEAPAPLPPGGGDAVRFFSAPGEGRECVEIARLVLDEARRGMPFDRIAIALRSPELYTGLLRAALTRAGVPAWYSRGTSMPDPAGRAFLALLACADEDLSAHRFAEYLSLGQVPDLDASGGPPAPSEHWVTAADDDGVLDEVARSENTIVTSDEADQFPGIDVDTDESPVVDGTLKAPLRWDRLLVESAVLGGIDRWRRRLAGLARERELAYVELQSEEPDSPKALKLRRDLTDLGHLQRFALPVIELLDALPRAALWAEWLDALTTLAPRVLRRHERVSRILAELRSMEAIGPVTLEEVRTVLNDRLRTLRDEPSRRRYGRVLVCAIDELPGRMAQAVFVPGMAERLFPQKQREDPLLLDQIRQSLNRTGTGTDHPAFGALPTIEDRVARERLRLQLVAGAASERIYFSYPRMEMTESRPRVPSFYALEVDRAQQGRIPEPDEFQKRTDNAVQARLSWPAPMDADRAIDDAEHDLAIIQPLLRQDRDAVFGRARYLLDLNESLGRSLRSRWQRWQKRWSQADGLYAPGDHARLALQKRSLHARPYSVSALQKYAVCPYQFYLSAVLKLEPREDAAHIERLDPMTRGSIVHRIQAELTRQVMSLAAAVDDGRVDPRDPRVAGSVEQFRKTVDAIVAEFHDTLAPAIDRVWHDEVEHMTADIREWLGRLIADLPRWRPLHAEFGFGFAPSAQRDPMSQVEPVTLEGGWQLHGVVDLIEARTGAHALRVTDHKTGSNRTDHGLVVGGGETLQPVLYGLAVEAALGRPVTESRLSFCTSRGGFTERVVELGDAQRRSGLEVLEVINRALESGTLVPAPKEGACAWCDFRPVCGPNEEHRTSSKDRHLLGDLASLRDMP